MNIGNQIAGQAQTRRLIADGVIKLKPYCEVCGAVENTQEYWFDTPVKIHPHHYNGYHDVYHIWSVCRSCNRHLVNCHDGQFQTPEQARIFIFGGDWQLKAKTLLLSRIYGEIEKNVRQIEALCQRNAHLKNQVHLLQTENCQQDGKKNPESEGK